MRAIVGDYAVRHAESANQALDELYRGSHRDVLDRLHLRPLGEFVDGDVEVTIAPANPRERSQDVEAPDCEGP